MRIGFLLTVWASTAFCAVSIEKSTIPVLNMRDYYSDETRPQFVKGLLDAMQQYGCFAVVNAPLDPQIIDNGYSSARAFFNQSLDTKMEISGQNLCGQRGYSTFGSEIGKGEKCGDYKEFLMIGREMFPQTSKRLGHFLNIWPTSTHIRGSMRRLYNAMEDWMIPIEHAIEEALELKTDFLNKMTFEGDNTLRVSHFPVEQSESGCYNIWFAPHTDITLFTILPSATAEGLEIAQKDGSWLRVLVPENAFIVNCGDLLENLTNGFIKSSKQRVIKGAENKDDRYEIALYVHPKNNDKISPLPQFITKTGGKRLYPNATRWELLMERLADMGSCTDSMLDELAKSGLVEQMMQLNCANEATLERLKSVGYSPTTNTKTTNETISHE